MLASDREEHTPVVRSRGVTGFGKFVAFMAGFSIFLGVCGVTVVAYRMGQERAYTDLKEVTCRADRQYQLFAGIVRALGDQTASLSDAVSDLQRSVESIDSSVVTVRPPQKPPLPVRAFQSPKLPGTLREAVSEICHP